MGVNVLDSVHSQATDKKTILELKKVLSYKKTFWKKSNFGKKQIEAEAYFIDGRTGIFLTGLLPRVKKIYTGEINTDNLERFEPKFKPNLKGITFRDDQITLIEAAIKNQRGIIVSATGTGKSILAMGIMSCYPNDNILFLCHSISILEQMRAELIKFGFECNFIGGKNGSKEIKDGITLAIDKSLANIDSDKYDTHFDLTIIDEAHHVTSKTSNYGKILQNMLSPIKIGLTATMPSGREKILSMEGLLGPMIGNVTIQDGIKKGIFVKPKITLVNVPFQDSVGKLFKYPDIYREAVVESKIRNTLIVKNAIRQIDNNMTCLIMVKDIKHGENIIEIVCEKFSEYADNFLFIQGSTDTDVREKVKDSFENKEIKVVIATAIWREGINIKSLNSLIFAMSGKSAIQVLQTIGRTTRISEGKTSVEIIDFVDKYKYLSQHFCERLSIYLDEKWI